MVNLEKRRRDGCAPRRCQIHSITINGAICQSCFAGDFDACTLPFNHKDQQHAAHTTIPN